MRFELTPEEAQPAAVAVVKHYRKRRVAMKIEKSPWVDAPYRTTLMGAQSSVQILVEAQGTLDYGNRLKALATWLAARRHYAVFFIATMRGATAQAGVLH